MKQRFTHLIATAINARFGKAYFTSWLLLLFLMMGNVAWGQDLTNPIISGPACATAAAGQNLTLTVTGSNFRTGGGPNGAVVGVNGSTNYITPSNRTPTALVVTIPAAQVTTPTITIRVRQRSGSSTVISDPFTVNIFRPAAAAGPITGPSSVCTGSQATFSVGEITNATSYQWVVPTGASIVGNATSNQITVDFSTATTGNISVAGVNGCGVAGTARTMAVTVNATPGVPTGVTADQATVCERGSVNLSATAGANSTTVRWYTAATGGILFATGTSVERVVINTTTFYASSYNATTGCESQRVPVTVTVIPVPSAPTDVAATPEEICGSGTVILSATPGEGANTVRWYTAPREGDLLETGTSVEIPITESTVFYAASYNSDTGCESSMRRSVRIRVLPLPAPPTVIGGAVCDGGEVTLEASSGAIGTEVRWYSAADSDEVIITGDTYTVDVSQTTTYYVASYNTITGCESERVAVTATVIATPVATVIPEGPLQICSGTPIVLATTAPPAGATYTYQWSNEEGEIEGATSRTYSVSESGTYFVVITSSGLCVSEPSNAVTVSTLPLPEAPAAEGAVRCGPGPVTLTASGAGEGENYRWYTIATGGSPVGTGASFTTPELALSRPYYVAIVGENGCESPRTEAKATVTPLPVASIASETPRCQEPVGVTTFLLNGTVTNGTFLEWAIIGGTASAEIIENAQNDLTPTVNVSGAGTVQVQLTVAGNNGCDPATAVIELEVYPIPPVENTQAAPVQRCGPGEVTLSIIDPDSDITYNWYNSANALVGTGESISVDITETSTYFIAVAGTGACENPQRTSVTAIVNELEVPTGDLEVANAAGPITNNNPPIIGESVTFTVTSDIPEVASYIWYIGDEATGVFTDTVVTATNSFTLDPVSAQAFDVRVDVIPDISDGTSCFDILTLVTAQPLVPLPVEIIYFNAAKQGHNVLLEWATASEENNTGFEVQVSQDGFNFRKLDFVPTKNGNTAIKQVYTYKDTENGKRGTRYYRLKQLDEDGRFEYFTTKAVTFTEVASKVKAFPNPFATELTLDIAAESSGQVQVTLWNAVGRQLMEQTVEVEKGFNTVKLDIDNNLPHSMYIIRVYLDGKMHQLKLLKE